MAAVVIAEGVREDFECILRHLEAHDSPAGPRRVAAIISAIDVLESSPLIGRPIEHGHRELVIGRGAAGYVALYRYDVATDLIIVSAVRGQREGRLPAPPTR